MTDEVSVSVSAFFRSLGIFDFQPLWRGKSHVTLYRH